MRVKDFLKLYHGRIQFITNDHLTGGRCNDDTCSPIFNCWTEEDRNTILNWFKEQDEELEGAFIGCMTINDSIHGMSEKFYENNPEYKHTYLQMSFSYK